MMCGAFIGFTFLGFALLGWFHGYDHGFGEGQRCNFAGTMIGALTGLVVDRLWRRKQLGTWRYSTGDLFVLLTMSAVVFALLIWADSTTWPP